MTPGSTSKSDTHIKKLIHHRQILCMFFLLSCFITFPSQSYFPRKCNKWGTKTFQKFGPLDSSMLRWPLFHILKSESDMAFKCSGTVSRNKVVYPLHWKYLGVPRMCSQINNFESHDLSHMVHVWKAVIKLNICVSGRSFDNSCL